MVQPLIKVRYILTRRQKLRATDPASKGGSFFGELGPKRKEVARDGKMYETVKMVLAINMYVFQDLFRYEKMNFDAVDGDSKGTISSGLYVGFWPSLANQAVDNPLQRLWAVDAADNWTQLIAKEAAVIFLCPWS